jgi:hypothetical protein
VDALLLLVAGKPADALAAAESALALRSELLGLAWLSDGLQVALEAAVELDDEAKLDELLALVEELPPGELMPPLRAIGARFAAKRAALRGESGTVEAALVAAAVIFRQTERPFDLAVVLLEHAEWLVAEGRAAEARPLLDEAREIFERLRAAPWLERLAAVGAPAALPS